MCPTCVVVQTAAPLPPEEKTEKRKAGWQSLGPAMLRYIKTLMAVSSSLNGCKHPVGEL